MTFISFSRIQIKYCCLIQNPCVKADRMDRYSERRNKFRLPYGTPITIEDSAVCFLYNAWLANFSGRGLYFETDLLLPPGAKVRIGIHDSSNSFFSEDSGRFIVEIIWRNSLIEDTFNYGYGAKVLFYDEVKDLRKNPRKTFSKLIFFISPNKYYEGVIKNLSPGGAFIETRAKFPNRAGLKFVVPGPNKYILLKGKIIHFKQTGFGIKFKRVLKIDKFLGIKRYNR